MFNTEALHQKYVEPRLVNGVERFENGDEIEGTQIPGVLIYRSKVRGDSRGSFQEKIRYPYLEKVLGQEIKIVQENESRNNQKGVLRGIHFAPWEKAVRCSIGQTFVVIVDGREGSPTFGKAISLTIGEQNQVRLWVPAGCGHAYMTLTDLTVYEYSVTQLWRPDSEPGVAWNDPNITRQITWPISEPTLSNKDQENSSLRELFPEVNFSEYPWLRDTR